MLLLGVFVGVLYCVSFCACLDSVTGCKEVCLGRILFGHMVVSLCSSMVLRVFVCFGVMFALYYILWFYLDYRVLSLLVLVQFRCFSIILVCGGDFRLIVWFMGVYS